jgi:hypothetical protein
MLLVEMPWAARVWALPFLCALAPSERYAARQGKHHKKITEWAWQLLLLIRRWYPQREIVAVADRAYASLKLLNRCRKLRGPITFITRLRLDAALYEPAPPRRPGQIGSLGRARVGVAVFECPCSVRALLHQARQTAQEDNRLGPSNAPLGEALVARA